MKSLALIIVVAVVLSGCNNLNDLRPIDPYPEIPEATVKTVKEKFPKGEDLIFKPVLEDKIWEVKLKSDADRYTSLVDYGKMWETFKVSPDGVPSALVQSLDKTAFGGGVLSAHSIAYFATTAANKLIYNYKGEAYSFEWGGASSGGGNSTAGFDRFLYKIKTYEVNDLPVAVGDTIKARSGMTFTTGETWVGLDDTRRYFVTANQKYDSRGDRITMLFDEKGKLVWSYTDYFRTDVPDATWVLQTVPGEIEQYISNTLQVADYEYETKNISNVRGLTSYYIVLKIGGYSRCVLYFDKDFNMVNKKYSVILY